MNHGRTQRQEGSGRPRETTEREDQAIVRAVLTVPDASLLSIVRATSASVTARTIHRQLTERGLRSQLPLHRLPLMSVQRQACLQWSPAHLHCNVSDWNRIVRFHISIQCLFLPTKLYLKFPHFYFLLNL